ncbi:Vitamin B6 biosynthesis protein [Sulfolobus islandicus Y.G.57.14]|jgi:pyridoxal 5'-phosphate synthase pdxS subunit|uniref:Pyridoxal 5'-phosphate synthase subunit PdxS n=8 Tax=Saccharolobus islandicus TaxID=43080 RepID=PDXS_SACI2|nr:pyridoxal 5'-phosphate synthase lyase subunit PdxS [Sulfolobus islandicus]C3MQK8.1 RecName: Full=Pyridoxal 5'-phosphate synthase subunit PdxS; Short=PLP synthase subunit PdxS; AltName: Full=Pdx1 [Sulfolobus islandicus L.S.2.15]C3MW86.1 RecName: Full=Pyridoxal 5'-phosphate synthase subunit PdxS; Short=PLP synthase subunit PdxS; AltName: Full=Pdx1 [Sulfolobus islandicus M.14.25]C3N6C8.1 RecName: Full=Pyridoxal 5'-phosphate synthase subunit PdxS; Short=PLP synthase subunit PdxS; AltName: Full=Pd
MRLYELSFAQIEDFFYKLAEVKDIIKDSGLMEFLPELKKLDSTIQTGTTRVKHAFPIFQKGGVVMDITNVQQAQIAEEAGAVAVMVLDKLPYDVRKSGGVARMADPKIIGEVMNSITIPVMAKVRIGHYYEAKLLEALGVDMIDESEVLTPADEEHHINKWEFSVPFVNGARNLGEALRRTAEGASMIRTKGEAGTGNVSEAVKHMKIINSEIRSLISMSEEDRVKKAREYQVPYQLVELTAKIKRLPIVNFAAGGIATPADAALMMWLGADGLFVGSGIFKSQDPDERAKAVVLAAACWEYPEIVLEAQKMISEQKSMMGIDIKSLKPEELLQVRGL